MKITVCGAGNSALGMAADLSFMGHDVTMFELPEFKSNLVPIKDAGGIVLKGPSQSGKNGFVSLAGITWDPKEAFEGAELIMFAVPCYGHQNFMETITPHLEDGQVVVFNTGYWASVRFQDLLVKYNKKVTLAETSLHIYLCRKSGPAEATIDAVKQSMLFSAFPQNRTEDVLALIKPLYPQMTAVDDFLEIHFNNLNHIVHGPIALLNVGTIENLGEKPYYFYRDGSPERVSWVTEAVDEERMAVARAAGLKVPTIVELITNMYGHMGAVGDSVYEARKGNKADETFVFEPASFIFNLAKEDMPFGFIPIISLGESLGVECPLMRSIVHLQCAVCKTDFWAQGLTLERLGLGGMDLGQIKTFLSTGRV